MVRFRIFFSFSLFVRNGFIFSDSVQINFNYDAEKSNEKEDDMEEEKLNARLMYKHSEQLKHIAARESVKISLVISSA